MHLLYSMLVLAVLTNGSYFWLQKAQLIVSPTYQDYLQALDVAADGSAQERPTLELEGFYDVPKPWIPTKLLKDLFICVFAAASILLLRHSGLPITSAWLLPALLGLVLAVAFVRSMYLYGAWVGIAGLRPVTYLAAGLLGVWASNTRSLDLLCRYLVAVLVIELMLSLYEYFFGIPLFSTARLGNRVNGTFSFPASLGIFAVTVCALSFTFSNISRILLLSLTTALVGLTGSATAFVLLAVLLAIRAALLAPDAWRVAVRISSVGVITVILLTLPYTVARYDVLDSLWGRIEIAADYFAHRPPLDEILFGKGLGIGSNLVTSAVTHAPTLAQPIGIDLFHARADSTPMALINQAGLAGVLLLYLLLATAAWKDRAAAPIYAILFLAGMTVNLLELFPVNFLLGLLLCHSLLTNTRNSGI